MNSNTFQNQNEDRWRDLEGVLDRLDQGKPEPEDAERLPGLFRQACSDASLAEHRMYGLSLSERLNRLVIRSYHHIHREVNHFWRRGWRFLGAELPQIVRKEWRLFWLTMLLFWAPFFAMVASSYFDQRWVESILSPEQMRMLQMGFGHDADVSDLRDNFGSNFAMFAFYIRNNVGIDLRIFAGGALFGLGTIFFVIFNGLAMGASTGYLMQAGDPMKFLNWTSGHATPELIGMIFAAMAGFKIGFAMIKPGRFSRRDALVRSGRVAIRLLFGAAFMTTFAAVIEGFWSPVAFPENVKYTFGVVIVVTMTAYLLLAGRGTLRGA
tara:strand:+ start:7947 stop:8918 length:972 start_codon:yes stop_codon:yes gene_type:complete